jgi:phytoene/squalene synthetase
MGASLHSEAAHPVPDPSPAPVSIDAAYEFCAGIARSHYENFTIASWLMPSAMRRHMYAIYAYARFADDFADEEHDLAKLDWWERELDLAYAGSPRHPDVDFKGFETLDDLLGYARFSANPVGRLVLYLFGYRDEERRHLSDLVCSGLQLANFWQDVAIDLDKGRIYLPRRDMARFGVTADDLGRRALDERIKSLLACEVEVARRMLLEGGALYRLVDRRLSRDILMFAGGGLAILRAIENAGYDVFRRRPKLSRTDYLKLGWNAFRGRLQS